MKNTGKAYEKLTQCVFSQIINQNQASNIDVQHDVILTGKTTSHQIDVYWKFEVGGIEYSAIIQAKDWANKVKQSDMLAFKGILDDLPSGTKGIYVSRSGYQSGAIEVAQANGISIYELRPPKNEDWDGYIKTITLTLNSKSPIFRNITIILDKGWADANCVTLPAQGEELSCADYDCLYDLTGNLTGSLSDVFHELADRNPQKVDHVDYTFPQDVFLKSNGQYIKVRGISGEFGHHVSRWERVIDAEDFVGCVLKDVTSGKTKMFDKQNQLKQSAVEG